MLVIFGVIVVLWALAAWGLQVHFGPRQVQDIAKRSDSKNQEITEQDLIRGLENDDGSGSDHLPNGKLSNRQTKCPSNEDVQSQEKDKNRRSRLLKKRKRLIS